MVHAAKGVYVQGLAKQTGRRYTKVRESGKKKRGGARKKGDYSMSHLQKNNADAQRSAGDEERREGDGT